MRAQVQQQNTQQQLQASHSYNAMPTQAVASHYDAQEQLQSASSLPGAGQYGGQRVPQQQYGAALQRPPQIGGYSGFQVSRRCYAIIVRFVVPFL